MDDVQSQEFAFLKNLFNFFRVVNGRIIQMEHVVLGVGFSASGIVLNCEFPNNMLLQDCRNQENSKCKMKIPLQIFSDLAPGVMEND
jgi:hypothetical protein